MAGEVDKGITITFRGDSISFDNTVANINRSIQLLKNEAARLNRELKFDPSNVELLKQRFQALTQVQELSAKQLNTYRNYLYEAMGEKGREKIEKSVQGFKELEQRIEQSEAKAEELGKEMKALVDSNGMVTDPERWRQLRAEQTKVNFELNSLTQELITAAEATRGGITDDKKWADTTRMVKNLSTSLEDAEKHLNVMAEKFLQISGTYQGLDKLQKKFESISDTFTSIGNATSKLSADAWKNITAASNAAIEFEEAFAGVKKTVEKTANTSYEDLMLSIRQMAKEIPATTTELSKIAEISGQLGVSADNLMDFTRVVADLGATTNISGQEAATALAQIFNVTSRGDWSNIDEFASTLVDLGNNAATDEKRILELAQRLAATANFAGMTQAEILGLSTAMASVGLSAEAGGSAISRIIQDISKVVAENGENLKTWAQTAGMTAEEFKSAWGTDSIGVLSNVIKGLSDADAAGEEVILMLEDLGISNIRTRDTMTRLVSASGLLTDYVDRANKAWEENTALSDEASKRYQTVRSQLTILKNTFNDMAISIGEIMLPYIKEIVINIQSLVNRFTDLDEGTRKIIIGMGLFAASIAPVSKAIAALTGENGIAGMIKNLKNFIGKEGFGGKIASALGNFDLSSLAAVGPQIAIVAALAVALGGALLANDELRASLVETWNTVVTKLTPVVQGLIGWLNDLWATLVSYLQPEIDALIGLGTNIWHLIEQIILVISDLISWLFGDDGLGPLLRLLWDVVKAFGEWIFVELIGTILGGLIDAISSVIGWLAKAIDKVREFIGWKERSNNTPLYTANPTISSSAKSFGSSTPISSGGLGMNTASLGRLQLASGGNNTLSLTTNINVNNNGTPIDESVVRRWGNVITDIVSDNLGKRW